MSLTDGGKVEKSDSTVPNAGNSVGWCWVNKEKKSTIVKLIIVIGSSYCYQFQGIVRGAQVHRTMKGGTMKGEQAIMDFCVQETARFSIIRIELILSDLYRHSARTPAASVITYYRLQRVIHVNRKPPPESFEQTLQCAEVLSRCHVNHLKA